MASLTSLVPCKHYYEHRIGGHDSDTITGKNDKRHKTFIVFLTLNKNFQTMDVKNKRSIFILWYLSYNQWFIFFFEWNLKNLWFIHLWYYLCLFFQNLQGCLKSNVYVFEFFYSFALKPHSIVFRLWYIVVSQHRIHIKWVPTVL